MGSHIANAVAARNGGAMDALAIRPIRRRFGSTTFLTVHDGGGFGVKMPFLPANPIGRPSDLGHGGFAHHWGVIGAGIEVHAR
jgi:hypothetical protein